MANLNLKTSYLGPFLMAAAGALILWRASGIQNSQEASNWLFIGLVVLFAAAGWGLGWFVKSQLERAEAKKDEERPLPSQSQAETVKNPPQAAKQAAEDPLAPLMAQVKDLKAQVALLTSALAEVPGGKEALAAADPTLMTKKVAEALPTDDPITRWVKALVEDQGGSFPLFWIPVEKLMRFATTAEGKEMQARLTLGLEQLNPQESPATAQTTYNLLKVIWSPPLCEDTRLQKLRERTLVAFEKLDFSEIVSGDDGEYLLEKIAARMISDEAEASSVKVLEAILEKADELSPMAAEPVEEAHDEFLKKLAEVLTNKLEPLKAEVLKGESVTPSRLQAAKLKKLAPELCESDAEKIRFCEIFGFDKEELFGKPDNIVPMNGDK